MSDALPVVSGRQLVKALEKLGWCVARQRGSHVHLKHPDQAALLVVPMHRELKRGTLNGLLRDASIGREELRRLL